MAGINKQKLFKQWSGKSDLDVIKQVNQKKENYEHCIEFLALRYKTPITEYKVRFKASVLDFIKSTLTEGNQFKNAVDTLKSFKYDAKCNLLQIAYECDNQKIQESLLDYIKTMMVNDIGILPEVYFENFEVLQQLVSTKEAAEKWRKRLQFLDLETLMSLEKFQKQELLLDICLENKNLELIKHLGKEQVWDIYVMNGKTKELVNWFNVHYSNNNISENLQDLHLKYKEWHWTEEMIEYAMRSLKDKSEAFENCLASLGYFDEKDLSDGKAVIRRIATIGKLSDTKKLIEKYQILPFAKEKDFMRFLLGRTLGLSLINPFNEDLGLLKALLEFDVSTVQGWQKLMKVAKTDFKGRLSPKEEVLITLFENLTYPEQQNLSKLAKYEFLQPDFMPLAIKNSHQPLEYIVYEALGKTKGINPSFFLIDQFHLMENYSGSKSPNNSCINYLTYLKQCRSAYATYMLLISQMQMHFLLSHSRIFKICNSVASLIFSEGISNSVICHCIAFIEMLGFDSQLLRIIKKFQQLLHTKNDTASRSFQEFLNQVEENLFEKLSKDPMKFPFDEYEAMQMLLRRESVEEHNNLIIKTYANRNDWWHFLLLICFFDTPFKLIQILRKSFKSEIMGEHFARVFIGEFIGKQRKKSNKSNKKNNLSKTSSSDGEKISEASSSRSNNTSNYLHIKKLTENWHLDIFEIILLSDSSISLPHIPLLEKLMDLLKVEEKCSTSFNLMENAIRFNLPVLAVLSTLQSTTNLELKWLIYITVSTNQWSELNSLLNKGIKSLFWHIVEYSIKNNFLDILLRSFQIFFKDHEFLDYLKLLYKTQYKKEFNDDVVNHLRSFMFSWSKDKIHLPLFQTTNRDQIMNQSIRLLLMHMQKNFDSSYEVRQLLDCICLSDINEICQLIDFMLLSKIYSILQSRKVAALIDFNFENLLKRERLEYELILNKLKDEKLFDESIQLALLLQLPIGDIIYAKWVDNIENEKDFSILKKRCEEDLKEYSLPPAMLVNFYLYGSTRLIDSPTRKYEVLKSALEVIKEHHLFPNESFDRDQIEYETILSYIQIEDENFFKSLDIYHSEYYEQIMFKERCVLYKSFMELKELAGIDDIAIGPKTPLTFEMTKILEGLICRLLDDCDIVQALRIQELFEFRPLDLRFLVYCMALAEDFESINSLPLQDRELLSDIEKSAYSKFNKRTLNVMHSNDSNPTYSFSLREATESSDGDSTLGFEVFPSKEKKEILNLIQGIASKLKSGIEIGKRIVLAYRAAMHLDKEYLDVLRTKDVSVLLNSVAQEDCLNRILVVNDIISSTKMSETEISDLLALELTTAIIRPKFYIFNSPQHNKNTFKNLQLWGYNIDKDFHIFLELTPNSTLLGNTLLEYCDALKAYRKYQDNKPYNHNPAFDRVANIIARYGLPSPVTSHSTTSLSIGTPNQVLSHKKQNLIYVELLIKAHHCFVHECSMEGIANILHRTKVLNTILTIAKSWSLIVQMLIGIGRYREMFYCFDSLIENEQFESLLGQFDYEKTNGLKQGILAYLREHNSNKSKEILKLSALHFLMYKELADMWCEEAEIPINKVLSSSYLPPSYQFEKDKDKDKDSNLYYFQNLSINAKTSLPKLKCSEENINLLNQSLYSYSTATENYLLDNKLMLAQKTVAAAELVAMQIDIITKAMEKTLDSAPCVLNLKSQREFRDLINTELSVPQTIILGRHYNHDINWCEALLCQYIILEKSSYLNEYLEHFRVTDSVINNVVKGIQKFNSMNNVKENNITTLINLVKSVELKYKLASLFGLKGTILSIVNGPQSYILKDTTYGKKKCFNFPEF